MTWISFTFLGRSFTFICMIFFWNMLIAGQGGYFDHFKCEIDVPLILVFAFKLQTVCW